MSMQAITWAWPHELDLGPKCVLVALATMANGEGVCWPKIDKLAGLTGACERSVKSYLRDLKNACLIGVKRRGPTSAIVTLNLTGAAVAASSVAEPAAEPAQEAPEKGASVAPVPRETGATLAPLADPQEGQALPLSGASVAPLAPAYKSPSSVNQGLNQEKLASLASDAASLREAAARSQEGAAEAAEILRQAEPAPEPQPQPPAQEAAPPAAAAPPPPPPPKPTPVPTSRGHRLPADWRPSPDLETFATGLGLAPDAVTDNFRDYWHAKAGVGACKMDWDATFRVWCRREAERAPPPRQRSMLLPFRRAEPYERDGAAALLVEINRRDAEEAAMQEQLRRVG